MAREMVQRFLGEVAVTLPRLEACLAENRHAEARGLAHDLKSVSGLVGALELQAATAALEGALKRGDPAGEIERVRPLADEACRDLRAWMVEGG